MGQIKTPQPVKLIVPMLAHDTCWFERAAETLSAQFGPVDWRSELLPFENTAYYVDEMGAPQWRLLYRPLPG